MMSAPQFRKSLVGKVSVIGFCFGGYATYVAAYGKRRFSGDAPHGGGIAAKVGDIAQMPDTVPFRNKDAAIPLDDLYIKDALQDSSLYVYDDSGHHMRRPDANPGAARRLAAQSPG